MSEHVIARRLGGGGVGVGHLRLDAPKTLNSLNRDMVEALLEHLDAWRDDDSIAAIVIDGSGDKAFCAGGDVQALRASSLENPGGPCDYAEHFFAREYRMNHKLHRFPKPILCWGHGVVMGGGLGILAGCSHRVVSERTRIGMPEISIALFPDVGGSYFLNRMPGQVGRFLALTAANINASDALFCGLGTHFMSADQHEALINALSDAAWSGDAERDRRLLDDVVASLATTDGQPEPQLEPALDDINRLMAGDDLSAIAERLATYEGANTFIAKACAGFAYGSKLAAAWIFRQLNATRDASLEQVFDSELKLGTNIMRHPEFAEGVRALLIDKDRSPAWQYPALADIPESVVDSFFTVPANAPSLDLSE